ncbi:hypothetical protein [Flavobacterium sp. I3-2]|uniref:hypothetical protein n=1 Tax=Flavobacterium sp. I3-2 TaxID=2748319 RepID=UPI0015B168D5|nr:hypothetical protein [Flavobacterium sp. I3-2]
MKKIFLSLALLLFSVVSFGQQNKSVEIESKIQNIIQNNTFIPETKNGTLIDKNGKELNYNTSFYYFLDTEKLFSVLYEQHDEISLNKTYYYDNDQLVLVVIEKINNKAATDRIVEQIFYFYDNGELIDSSDYKAKNIPTELYTEGMNYLKDFN